jgi:hypothetical protein
MNSINQRMTTNNIMEQYLQHQQATYSRKITPPSEAGSSVAGGRRIETALVDVPDNVSLEEFKHQVRMWMEIDNQVKKFQQVIREKKQVQKVLSEKILGFMSRYNIEDLNTKEGKLRYKVSYTRPSVKKTSVKEKLQNYFEHDPELAKKVTAAVFEEEDSQKVEKVSLRRLKGVRIMNV